MSLLPSGCFIYKHFQDWISRIVFHAVFDKTITSPAVLELLIVSHNRSQQTECAQLSLNCRCYILHFQSISRTSWLRLILLCPEPPLVPVFLIVNRPNKFTKVTHFPPSVLRYKLNFQALWECRLLKPECFSSNWINQINHRGNVKSLPSSCHLPLPREWSSVSHDQPCQCGAHSETNEQQVWAHDVLFKTRWWKTSGSVDARTFTLQWVIFKITCIFHIPFLRHGDSVGDQLLDTRNVISRFRANLVIAGVEPFEEDNWSHLIIGNTRFVVSWHSEINDEIFKCIEGRFLRNECAPCVINPKVTGQCGRCHMVGVDQDTGTKTNEPLMSLSAYRAGKVGPKQFLPVRVDTTCEVHGHEKTNHSACYFIHF